MNLRDQVLRAFWNMHPVLQHLLHQVPTLGLLDDASTLCQLLDLSQLSSVIEHQQLLLHKLSRLHQLLQREYFAHEVHFRSLKFVSVCEPILQRMFAYLLQWLCALVQTSACGNIQQCPVLHRRVFQRLHMRFHHHRRYHADEEDRLEQMT